MKAVLSISAVLRTVFAGLVVLALLVRAAIPAGYMLDRVEGSNEVVMRICNGGFDGQFASFNPETGAWVMLTGAESDDGDAPLPVSDHESCDFALSMVPDLPHADGFALQQVFGLPMLAGRVFVSDTYRPVIRAPLPARGPPSLI